MYALTCVVDRPDLATITLAGNDVLSYLHAVCTQHTLDLQPGDATQALLLSPKGKIEFAFRLAVLDKGSCSTPRPTPRRPWPSGWPGSCSATTWPSASPPPGPASLLGPDAEAALAAAGLPVPAAGRAGVAAPDLVVQRTPVGFDLVGPAALAVLATLERAGVERAGAERWEQAGSSTACPGPAAS